MQRPKPKPRPNWRATALRAPLRRAFVREVDDEKPLPDAIRHSLERLRAKAGRA